MPSYSTYAPRKGLAPFSKAVSSIRPLQLTGTGIRPSPGWVSPITPPRRGTHSSGSSSGTEPAAAASSAAATGARPHGGCSRNASQIAGKISRHDTHPSPSSWYTHSGAGVARHPREKSLQTTDDAGRKGGTEGMPNRPHPFCRSRLSLVMICLVVAGDPRAGDRQQKNGRPKSSFLLSGRGLWVLPAREKSQSKWPERRLSGVG